jgi:hypothetical protein
MMLNSCGFESFEHAGRLDGIVSRFGHDQRSVVIRLVLRIPGKPKQNRARSQTNSNLRPLSQNAIPPIPAAKSKGG